MMKKPTFSLSELTAILNDENRPDFFDDFKSEMESLLREHVDNIEFLSPVVRKRVEVLRKIQDKYVELEVKFLEERAALESKYQKLYQPLFTERYEIVNGVTEVEGAANETKSDSEEDNEKGVSDFWLTAMKRNDVLAVEISERDEAALSFLKDIKWSRIENIKGFKLDFFFESNPYFSNSVLTKTYHMIDEDDWIMEKAIGTEIQWLPGKCLTQKVLTRKPKKGSKNAKPITKTVNCESFFNFFNPPEIPDSDDDIYVEMAEEIQNQMEQDYYVGSTIRDKIIPRAVSWFTCNVIPVKEINLQYDEDEAFEDGIFEEDDDKEEEEDNDKEEEEDDKEDDEDEEESKSKKKSSALKGARAQLGDDQLDERPPE